MYPDCAGFGSLVIRGGVSPPNPIDLIATDDQQKLTIAERLGADVTLDARESDTSDRIRTVTGGGASLVIETSGFTMIRQQAISIAAPGATIVLLGLGDATSDLSVLDVINCEISIWGSYSGTDSEFRRSIELLANDVFDVGSWIETTVLE
jgi:propanol-preferring alcohol dehydrogenase